ADLLREFGKVVGRDDQLVLRPSRVEPAATPAVRKQPRTLRTPLPIDRAGDAEAQQHPLHRLQGFLAALRQADADTLFLRALDAAVGIEQPAQQSRRKGAGPPLQ